MARPGSPIPQEGRGGVRSSLKMEQLGIFSAYAEEENGANALRSSRSFFNAPTYASFREGGKGAMQSERRSSYQRNQLPLVQSSQSFVASSGGLRIHELNSSNSLYEATMTSSASMSMFVGGVSQSPINNRQSISFHRSARLSADGQPTHAKSAYGALCGIRADDPDTDDDDVKSSLCSSSSDEDEEAEDVPEPEEVRRQEIDDVVHR